jgi:hypothetical protein
MVWGQQDRFCDFRFRGRWCTTATTLHVTPPNPQNDGSIGLGDRQRRSPLTNLTPRRMESQQAWSVRRWGHFCDILFLSVTLGQVLVVHVTPKPLNDWSIGLSWGPAKGAARSPRRMESQQAWSGGGGITYVTSGFCRFTRLAPAATSGERFLRRASKR